MTPGEKDSSFRAEKAVMSAIRHFPRFELTIRRMIKTNNAFQEVCEELAEAECALSRADSLPAPLRDLRREEWEEMVNRLVGEVWEEIRRDAVSRGISMP